MKEKEYYIEIENYIKRNEVNKKRRVLEENYDILNNYWHIGKTYSRSPRWKCAR